MAIFGPRPPCSGRILAFFWGSSQILLRPCFFSFQAYFWNLFGVRLSLRACSGNILGSVLGLLLEWTEEHHFGVRSWSLLEWTEEHQTLGTFSGSQLRGSYYRKTAFPDLNRAPNFANSLLERYEEHHFGVCSWFAFGTDRGTPNSRNLFRISSNS